jgi:hypothetical protein
MPTNTPALVPPPKLKAAHEEAKGLAAKGLEIFETFRQGDVIDPQQAEELAAALRAGNARFREEWAAYQTELPDGRRVFTPDYMAVQTLLAGTGAELDQCIRWIDGNGRVVNLLAIERDLSDITPISALTALRELWLGLNQIRDITPLSGLAALRYLVLSGNQIQDLGPLSGLTALTELGLSENRIQDVAPLSNLPALQCLDLHCNQIQDIAPLASLQSLRGLLVQANPLGPTSREVLSELRARGVFVKF